ncbi:hypothetical protein ACFQ3N_19645 [Virgibacillus byunsanensis]|uniref:Uncharacterized protein n=1 Tax=Virgibacillus byunsanensis TaxID=570945 RepID=A0ABW3LRI1_9BACI
MILIYLNYEGAMLSLQAFGYTEVVKGIDINVNKGDFVTFIGQEKNVTKAQ